MNTNAYDHEIVIAGKEYKHGVFCHANGTLVYPVGGQYVRFEAEVGIDDTSSGGSVFFPGIEYGSDLCGGRIEQQVSGRNRYAGCGTGRPGIPG